MNNKPDIFSDTQVELMSVMNLFDSPMSMDILRTLRPLSPSEYLDLLEKGDTLHIIKKDKSGTYSLKKNLPATLKKRIDNLHTTENISHLLRQIEIMHLADQLPP